MATKVIRYQKKRILSTTEKGLLYVDEQDIESFIDFKTCRKNWVAFVNSGEDFKGKNITENDTKCVGRRDITGKPPYIEFFAEPHISFEFQETWFDRLFRRNKSRQDFRSLRQAIDSSGWSTFDMS